MTIYKKSTKSNNELYFIYCPFSDAFRKKFTLQSDSDSVKGKAIVGCCQDGYIKNCQNRQTSLLEIFTKLKKIVGRNLQACFDNKK